VKKGKYVEDVRAEDIELHEEGVPQKVAVFEGPQSGEGGRRRIPVEVILLLDVSLSVMNRNLLDSFSVKETLLDGLGEDVGVAVYGFAGKLRRLTRPTREVERIKAALEAAYAYAHGGTRLYEAIMQTARDAASTGTSARRLMLVLSDGFSTTAADPEDSATVASAFGIQVYPVVLGHERVVRQATEGGGLGQGAAGVPGRQSPWGNRPPPGAGAMSRQAGGGRLGESQRMEREARAKEQERQQAEFAGVGEKTGGRSFDVKVVNNAMIRRMLESVVREAQAEYVAGYYPAPSGGTREARRVRVLLKEKELGKLIGGSRVVLR